jgi:hypothetical protein
MRRNRVANSAALQQPKKLFAYPIALHVPEGAVADMLARLAPLAKPPAYLKFDPAIVSPGLITVEEYKGRDKRA